jgi:hypothetical protein
MSEQTQNNSQQQMVMLALVVIAVLLAAIVGVMVWQQSRAAVPAMDQVQQPAAPAADAAAEAPAGMTGGTTQAAPDPAVVDASAATAVPKGTEPEAFVKGYYEACDKGDWKSAYNALPADKKAGQTPEGLQQQVEGYNVTSYAVTSAQVDGDKATIMADQVTGSYGTFENQWTFVKKDGVWYVTSKAVTGMK